ncbi:MAG: MauE/DoxX family redox-associated membrane protein [Opitutales bacterium]|jgi:uncharacterized membrane protein YphA (DoxX/SURF4 family)
MKTIYSLFFFILRASAALLFISSGMSKLVNPGRFLVEIQAFHLLPYWTAYTVAIGLPWLEIFCGFALFTLSYSSAAALVLMCLTISFMGFLGIAEMTGNYVDCGCFGTWYFIGNSNQHMLFNGILVLALAITFLRCAKLQRVFEQHR